MNGALIVAYRASEALPGNADDAAFAKAWRATAREHADVAESLGAVDNATPGTFNGYVSYASMTALKLAMRSASFSSGADTNKLISDFETLNVPQGPDFTDGPMLMNYDNHQGRLTAYLLRVDGQQRTSFRRSRVSPNL